ncbi:MAG TPA: c-type cytochrome [Saprospiraceae bacterium]|nr:c-type cytochrome [Saprospiraceae bacterium]HMQ84421.1 c-type cytochrome [Saprospiraceae bacterium]
MKKALKIIGILLGSAIVLILAALLYFNIKGFPKYEVNAPEVQISMDSATIARGEYLTNLSCGMCHTGADNKLSGGLMEDNKDFGVWYAANITQDPEHGIGKYTNGELMYLLRTGVKRDGEFAIPLMPRFVHLSDEDLKSIVAYLKSDANKVQPSAVQHPDHQPTLLVKILSNLVFKPLPYPETPPATVNPNDAVAYGKYLATGAFLCYDCHSASFETNDILIPENSPGYFGGGAPVPVIGNPADITLAANITPHPEHGIGNWTEEQFANAVRYGQGADGVGLHPAMPKFTLMTDSDVHAIWAYMQTVPAIDNEVKR